MFCATTLGLPGYVLAEMPRDQPAVGVVAAADAVADDEGDGLAFVEILRLGGVDGSGKKNEGDGAFGDQVHDWPLILGA